MINRRSLKLRPTLVGALQRPSYEAGSYLAANDLLTEQRHRLQRLRRHDRYLHGWGVLCGLQVVPAKEPGRPWGVRVCPGYAMGCCGEEIEVYSPAVLDIRDSLWNRPTEKGRPAPIAYVGIRYSEEFTKPVPATTPVCGCDETMYEPSRIQDSYKVDILWVLKGAFIQSFDLCARNLASCPECRDSPYVLLARVTLPASESDPITSAHIDHPLRRRHLAATTTLQDQLVRCCCGTHSGRGR